jgi:hypothetical protein
MGTKRVGLARTEALIENLKRELSGLRQEVKYVTDTDNQDFTSLTGNTTIVVNAAMADGKYIRLPEATTANSGMHIRVVFALAPAATALVGFVTSKIIGGAVSISDATEGQASANAGLASSAIGTSNLRVELDVDAAGKAGGHPGTVLDFWYHGVADQVIYRGHLIGDVDTATLASHFSTTAVNA